MAGFDNDVVYGINADYSNALGGTGASTTGELLTNGQLWIGATSTNAGGTHINVGTLTSPDSSITFGFSSPNITAKVTGGTTSVTKLTGNTGIATPSAGNINVITANATVKFVGSGSTLTQDFNQGNLSLGSSLSSLTTGIQNVGLGSGIFPGVTTGQSNTALGFDSLNALTSGFRNTAGGAGSLQSIVGDTDNTAFGYQALKNCVSANNNTAVGSSCLSLCTSPSNVGVGQSTLGSLVSNGNCTGVGFSVLSTATGGENTGLGFEVMIALTSGTQNLGLGTSVFSNLLTGTRNIGIGYGAGQGYTGSESSNIVIGNNGTAAESNVIRIGTQGSGTGQQNKCVIAGITGVTVANQQLVTINSSTGQLGVTTSSEVTWNVVSTNQTGTTSNGYIFVSPGGALTISLPTTSAVGDTFAVMLDGATSWQITQAAGQQIRLASSTTTLGATGSLTSTAQGNTVTLICRVANTTWTALSSIGNITVA